MVTSVLSDDTLSRCAERAPGYDRENQFFAEDFEDLRQAGYLLMAVPEEFGGMGMTLADVCREEARLAYHAPATALATNMHVYWTGVAADLWRAGDKSLVWMLEEAAAGEVFAAGHGERGNDFPLLASTSSAERVDGGYKFTGHKMFGSLTPVWTRLGIHAMDTSDPENPKVVHAFMPRDTEGYRIEATWDTLGMRATRSDDTILDGAFVPDKYVARVNPAGLAGADAFVLGVFAWAQCTFGSMYLAHRRVAPSISRPPISRRRRRSRSTGRRWRGTRRTSGWSRRCSSTSKARPRTSNAWPRTGPTASITAACGRRSSCRPSTTRSKRRSASSIGPWT